MPHVSKLGITLTGVVAGFVTDAVVADVITRLVPVEATAQNKLNAGDHAIDCQLFASTAIYVQIVPFGDVITRLVPP